MGFTIEDYTWNLLIFKSIFPKKGLFLVVEEEIEISRMN